MIISDKLKLCFIHTPKNGGTYTYHAMINQDKDIIIELCDYGTHHLIPTQKKVDEYLNRGYTVFGFIRDPYESIISNYNYLRTNKNHRLHNTVMKMSFLDFVSQEKLTHEQNLPDFLNNNYISQKQYLYFNGVDITPFNSFNDKLKILLNNDNIIGEENSSEGNKDLHNDETIKILSNNEKFKKDIEFYEKYK